MRNNSPSPCQRRRVLYLFLVLLLLFALLLIQFYTIQITEGKKWAHKANKQHFLIVHEPFPRGKFFGNGALRTQHPSVELPLVMDVTRYALHADPMAIPHEARGAIVAHLKAAFDLDPAQTAALENDLCRRTRYRKILSRLTVEQKQDVARWWRQCARDRCLPKNALFFVKEYVRSYPYGASLGQLLHTVRSSESDRCSKVIPTGGLELFFDPILAGRVGKRRLMRSPSHTLETGEVVISGEAGADVYLTIDPWIQYIMEEELERGRKKCMAKAGWGVMLDPWTGEILALAQVPLFDPRHYQEYFNHPEKIAQTKVQAVSDAHEPGSAFKMFTAAIALEANQELESRGEAPLFAVDEKMATSSGVFAGRARPITDTSFHRFLNFDMAVQKSSNIYMGRLAERIVARLGSDWYYQKIARFGFGRKTNLEIPAESAGVFPKTKEWSKSTHPSLAMGYNLQVTTLQLACGVAVFANGGHLVKPTLIRKIVKKNRQGESTILVDHTQSTRRIFPRVLDQRVVARVVDAMRYVTKPGGTSSRGDIPGYTEVGKSSTPKKLVNGRYSETLYCPNFAGFAPADHPRFVLVISYDEPRYGYIPGIGKNHHGGNCTASVFREIGKRTLEFLSIPQDDPAGHPYGDPRRNASEEKWHREVVALKALYDQWNQKNP